MGANVAPVLLIVEDEESYQMVLTVGLEREGYIVKTARDGFEALAVFDAIRPDLVLLDLMLPRLSGVEVCRYIRARSSVPIILVTARVDGMDAVAGLEMGADDCVTKPFRIRELVARVRAVLRRSSQWVPEEPLPTNGLLTVGDVTLDPTSHEVRVKGAEVRLPRKEFELLEVLLSNAGRVLSRQLLMERVWGAGYGTGSKTLDVHIKRLRSRIEQDVAAPERILTIRGVGYRYEGGDAGAAQPASWARAGSPGRTS
jgi:two-component system, OmpR family, response regulator RegX3